LKGYADGREAYAGIACWIAFYNGQRPHQALGDRTPMAVWRDGISGGLGKMAVDTKASSICYRFDKRDVRTNIRNEIRPDIRRNSTLALT
jgi:Integrase core domain